MLNLLDFFTVGNLEMTETNYSPNDDGRWEDDAWVAEQMELSACEEGLAL